MSGLYQQLDQPGGLDYRLWTFDSLGPHTLRGPAMEFSKPYVAFVGAGHTFGRFVKTPFPDLLGQRLGVQALNLGVPGAGPRHFNRPTYLEILNRAEAVIFQVLSGRSASNSLFNNSASGLRIGQSPLADGPLDAEEFFALAAKRFPPEELERLLAETRRDYTSQFVELIKKVNPPRILLWAAESSPADKIASKPPLGAFPHLVDARMCAELAAFCDDHVKVTSAEGLPQTLWPAEQEIEGATLNRGVLENRYFPSPEMHRQIADALEPTCRRFLGRPAPVPSQRGAARHTEAPVRFVIVAAERTGTTLLMSLLNQQRDVVCGGELFNPNKIAAKTIAWPNISDQQRPGFLDLRVADPHAFWRALYDREVEAGRRAVGFKLMYKQGLKLRPLLDALAADDRLRVIHITRRNLLRRLISEEQARVTGQWALIRNAEKAPRPPVRISIEKILENVHAIEQRQQQYEALFNGHPTLRVVYEHLAADPVGTLARTARFLGLPKPKERIEIRHQKMGGDSLAESLNGFAELRGRLQRWADFFDD